MLTEQERRARILSLVAEPPTYELNEERFWDLHEAWLDGVRRIIRPDAFPRILGESYASLLRHGAVPIELIQKALAKDDDAGVNRAAIQEAMDKALRL